MRRQWKHEQSHDCSFFAFVTQRLSHLCNTVAESSDALGVGVFLGDPARRLAGKLATHTGNAHE